MAEDAIAFPTLDAADVALRSVHEYLAFSH
jgi:hypothetical protein